MTFTAEFIGGELDGVRWNITDPPLPTEKLWGLRCLRACRVAVMLRGQGEADFADEIAKGCREKARAHFFQKDPAEVGMTATRYRRTGAKRNVHQYEVEDDLILGPGEAIFAAPRGASA